MSEYRNILKTINRNNNVINWTIKNKLIDIYWTQMKVSDIDEEIKQIVRDIIK